MAPLFPGVRLDVLRLDLVDSQISGNKWFKLKHHLVEAHHQGYKGLMSFGGAHSNHLHALAAAAARLEFPSIGFVRGGSDSMPLTPTLKDCRDWGMRLEGLSYGVYRQRYSLAFCQSLERRFPDYYLVPEGGSSEYGVIGVAEMIQSVLSEKGTFSYDVLVCPVGSGGTLAGILLALDCLLDTQEGVRKVWGVSALKGLNGKLEATVRSLYDRGVQHLGKREGEFTTDRVGLTPWEISHQSHLGGFGKLPVGAAKQLSHWADRLGFWWDPLYGGKMWLDLVGRLEQGEWDSVRNLLLIHTGGLQGWRGFEGQVSGVTNSLTS